MPYHAVATIQLQLKALPCSEIINSTNVLSGPYRPCLQAQCCQDKLVNIAFPCCLTSQPQYPSKNCSRYYITSRHVTLRSITSHRSITSRHVTSRHVTSHQITSHHITSHQHYMHSQCSTVHDYQRICCKEVLNMVPALDHHSQLGPDSCQQVCKRNNTYIYIYIT